MAILKNLSVLLISSITIFSGLNCFENLLLRELKKQNPTLVKQETLLGSTLALGGLSWSSIGSKKYTLTRRMLFRGPGLALMGIGIGSIANSLNEKYNWIK